MEAGALPFQARRGFLHQVAWRARRGLGFVASVACGVAVAVLAILGVLAVTGYSVLIERSDSMRPAIRVGDLIVTKRMSPRQVDVGDVVTFKDHTRNGDLVTHRVTEVREQRGRFEFVTKGDASGGKERWAIDGDGTIGAYVARVPRAGYLVSFLAQPLIRFAFVTLLGLLLAVITIRRIWKS
jgi:signal peptidase I